MQQKALVAVFKDFFQLLATMDPCPYCRHHLNMYVLQNKEVEMYPVEYLQPCTIQLLKQKGVAIADVAL